MSNHAGRFEALSHEAVDDGWDLGDDPPPLKTNIHPDQTKTIIARNSSPDVGFDRSINPYRGCEHGCVYCFARPSHAYLGLSPGLDFETQLFSKDNAATLLRHELARKSYACKTIQLGANTDPYQPIERRLEITRQILTVLAEYRHPVAVTTKSGLIHRDLDILAPMAADGLASAAISVTTLDPGLARRMEPRAPTPVKRLATIRRLAQAGVPVTVLAAPMIPSLTDHELENILAVAANAGATSAGYVLLRLPSELGELFTEWLHTHVPDRTARVLNRLKETRGGSLYRSAWGERQTGTGVYAALLAKRFTHASRKAGLKFARSAGVPLRTDLFQKPSADSRQLSMF